MDLEKAIDFIKENDGFLLSSHINPDGDGVGGVLGIIGLLKKLGKKYTAIFNDTPQKKLSFLEWFNEIKVFDASMEGNHSFKNAIIVDVPLLKRVGNPVKLLEKDARILNIDHHISNTNYGEINLVDPDSAASTQIIASIYEKMGIEYGRDVAMSLYTGICVDTGSFRYSNTTSEVLKLAARLVDGGAEPATVTEYLYQYCNMETTMGLSRMIDTIEIHLNGKVASAYLDYQFLSSEEGKHVDTEGFVNYPLSINGVDVAILIRENEEGKTRLSLRSSSDFDVNVLAKEFNGGGHAKAAGCLVEGSIEEVKKKLIEAIDAEMKRPK